MRALKIFSRVLGVISIILGLLLLCVTLEGLILIIPGIFIIAISFKLKPSNNNEEPDTPTIKIRPRVEKKPLNAEPIEPEPTVNSSVKKVKEYNFNVTGTKHYIDNIKKITEYNAEYSFGKDELEEDVKVFEKTLINSDVKLVPEPDNEYDSNAVRVDINGVTVGYMKKGNCTRVKNLMASPDFISYELNDFKFGKYKELKYDDYDDKYYLDKGAYETPVISVLFFVRNSEM